MKLLLLFLIITTLIFALTDEEITNEWTKFKKDYNKTYWNKKEENRRKQLFIKTLKEIETHNKRYEQGLETFEMGINEFADYTKDEWHNMLCKGDDENEGEDEYNEEDMLSIILDVLD